MYILNDLVNIAPYDYRITSIPLCVWLGCLRAELSLCILGCILDIVEISRGPILWGDSAEISTVFNISFISLRVVIKVDMVFVVFFLFYEISLCWCACYVRLMMRVESSFVSVISSCVKRV